MFGANIEPMARLLHSAGPTSQVHAFVSGRLMQGAAHSDDNIGGFLRGV